MGKFIILTISLCLLGLSLVPAEEMIGKNARGLAMGNSNTASPDKAGSYFWNPAALAGQHGWAADYNLILMIADEGNTLQKLVNMGEQINTFLTKMKELSTGPTDSAGLGMGDFGMNFKKFGSKENNPLVQGLDLMTHTLPGLDSKGAGFLLNISPFNGAIQTGSVNLNWTMDVYTVIDPTLEIKKISLLPQGTAKQISVYADSIRSLFSDTSIGLDLTKADSLLGPSLNLIPASTKADTGFQNDIFRSFSQVFTGEPNTARLLTNAYILALDSTGIDYSDPTSRDIALGIIKNTFDTSVAQAKPDTARNDDGTIKLDSLSGKPIVFAPPKSNLFNADVGVKSVFWAVNQMGIAYGRKITPWLNVGINPKLILGAATTLDIRVPVDKLQQMDSIVQAQLAKAQKIKIKAGLTLDLGFQFTPMEASDAAVFKHLKLGLTIRNLIPIKFVSEIDSVTKFDYTLRPQVRIGVATALLNTGLLEWHVSSDLDLKANKSDVLPGLESRQFGVGTEVRVLKILRLRTGFVTDVANKAHNFLLTAGLGIDLRILKFEVGGTMDPEFAQVGKFAGFPTKATLIARLAMGW